MIASKNMLALRNDLLCIYRLSGVIIHDRDGVCRTCVLPALQNECAVGTTAAQDRANRRQVVKVTNAAPRIKRLRPTLLILLRQILQTVVCLVVEGRKRELIAVNARVPDLFRQSALVNVWKVEECGRCWSEERVIPRGFVRRFSTAAAIHKSETTIRHGTA